MILLVGWWRQPRYLVRDGRGDSGWSGGAGSGGDGGSRGRSSGRAIGLTWEHLGVILGPSCGTHMYIYIYIYSPDCPKFG